MNFDAIFARHERIAFQFSGGRDSTAALYLLRPYWGRMRVYHVDTGDQFPETQAVVEAVSYDVEIHVIYTDVRAVRAEFGLPSDLVPVDNGEFGRHVSGNQVKINGRYGCCFKSLMEPMHHRMIEDDVTLIVRGQRDDEYATPPLRSGALAGGFELLYPIQEWTGAMVMDYLTENNLPVAPYYARGMTQAPECMGCTAWWDEGRAAYLQEYHPVAFVKFAKDMATVREEIVRQYAKMEYKGV